MFEKEIELLKKHFNTEYSNEFKVEYHDIYEAIVIYHCEYEERIEDLYIYRHKNNNEFSIETCNGKVRYTFIKDIIGIMNEAKATHMNNKLVEYKENSFTKEELDYIYMKMFGYSKDVSYCVNFSKQEKHNVEVSVLEKILKLRGKSHDK